LIDRELYLFLENWKVSSIRKPLILRGARQVGKTTLVKLFGKSYDQYLYFNLEKRKDLSLFKNIEDLDATIQLLFLDKGAILSSNRSTLIFIDEVQEKPEVIEQLRYFYEEYPFLHIIVTGSLLDFALDNIDKVPVGRVEFAELHPINFREFLLAKGNIQMVDLLDGVGIDEHLLKPLFDRFHEYALIGGMPEIVSSYLSHRNITKVNRLFSGLVEAYKLDVEKYSNKDSMKRVINHIMKTAPFEIDNRIVLGEFGNSSYKSREVKEAFELLHKARIMHLSYPTTETSPPVIRDTGKRPRLHFLDVGLINYQLGIQKELLTIDDLNQSTKGKLCQQIVSQEILSKQHLFSEFNTFWVREEKGKSAEVDVVYQFRKFLIPVEIKSGASGRLRSLHEFIDRCDHTYAIRLYRGPIQIDELESRNNKKYKLLNLPYFLAGSLDQYLDWFID